MNIEEIDFENYSDLVIEEVIDGYKRVGKKHAVEGISSENFEKIEVKRTKEIKTIVQFVKRQSKEDDSKLERIEQLIDVYIELYWYSAFLQMQHTVMWSKWRETKIGFLIQIAIATIKVVKKKNLSPVEISLLSGLSANGVRKNLKNNKKSYLLEKNGRQYEAPYEIYKDLLYFK